MELTLASARALHLAAQGLLNPIQKIACKADVLQCIRQMSALQIDTISVVARSPYLVLWSRLGQYQNAWLDELLAEGAIFEYWSHEACFLPIEDYALYRHQMVSPQGLGWKYNHRWLIENTQQVEHVRQHIQKHGETRSVDFERKSGKAGGWWEWKPEKRSLEVLFTTGELMVARRHKFQRVYDLRERVHPHWSDQRDLPEQIHCQQQQVLNAVKALGIAKASWISDYFRMGKLNPAIQPAQLAQQGLLISAQLADSDQPVYVHPDHEELLHQAYDGALKTKTTRILSPFDPVVWDRKRAAELFNFDYKLECYTPEAARRYGYFSLPILRNGSLIARMDAKVHRKTGVFEIKKLHLESDTRVSASLAADVSRSIKDFAQWQQCKDIQLQHCSSLTFFNLLKNKF
ncbi:crosslink repair DNA glycosylase YcaQ family protein [Undibacterium sp.]|uniref:winged helix-turn-helix domain-containing protein n=1 Tax=Undibacterium sp. TaxID=1914977 RepID=UPI0025ED0711|nr:crosslink repair DNA glycosylase YcaQ family protein [Undibacterium sp.]